MEFIIITLVVTKMTQNCIQKMHNQNKTNNVYFNFVKEKIKIYSPVTTGIGGLNKVSSFILVTTRILF